MDSRRSLNTLLPMRSFFSQNSAHLLEGDRGSEHTSAVAVQVIAFCVWEQHLACSDAIKIFANLKIKTETSLHMKHLPSDGQAKRNPVDNTLELTKNKLTFKCSMNTSVTNSPLDSADAVPGTICTAKYMHTICLHMLNLVQTAN